MTASEQVKIEFNAPDYLKNVIVIMTEMGLRPFKELMPMLKSKVDLENSVVHIPDSKTPSGVTDMPMTELARQAFKAQIDAAPGSEYLFPSPRPKAKRPYLTALRKPGRKPFAAWACGTSRFTSYVTPSRQGSVRAALPTISSPRCSGKAMRRSSSVTARPS
jgi:hypothetical protein